MPCCILSRLSLLLAATTALCVAPAMADPLATIKPLSGLSFAFGISGDGSTIVGLSGTPNDATAVYWSGSGLHDPAINPTGKSSFTGISADGSTLFGRINTYPHDQPFAFRNGVVTNLPTVGSAAELTASNADGSVIVGYGPGSVSTDQALEWTGTDWGTLVQLDQLAPAGSFALGIDGTTAANAADSIIVGASFASDGLEHGVYWKNNAIHDLGSIGHASIAYAISADGSVIGGTVAPLNSVDAVATLWTGAGFATQTDIGTLGGSSSYVQAIDADGSVVVGTSTIGSGFDTHLFRYADGTMADLNTLLTTAGVNMSGIELQSAGGISANGDYIAANDFTDYTSYLVYYHDGVGGLTDLADQQASVDGLGKQRQAVAVQYDAYSGVLIGDLDRADQSNTAGVFGLVGSAVGGARGHLGAGNGFSLAGGIASGSSEFGGAGIGNGLMGAVSLRYDAADLTLGAFHPFAQAGASFGWLDGIDFTRSYPGGKGTGDTDGTVASAFGRLGLTADLDNGDQFSVAGELGERWLATGAYAESFSADNPFPAAGGAGTDTQTVAKVSAAWSHRLSKDVDLTLRGAVGQTIGGSSGLKVATTGFGTLSTGIDPALWVEAGAHVSWNLSNNSAVDLYATGMAGADTAVAGHFGAGYHYKF